MKMDNIIPKKLKKHKLVLVLDHCVSASKSDPIQTWCPFYFIMIPITFYWGWRQWIRSELPFNYSGKRHQLSVPDSKQTHQNSEGMKFRIKLFL